MRCLQEALALVRAGDAHMASQSWSSARDSYLAALALQDSTTSDDLRTQLTASSAAACLKLVRTQDAKPFLEKQQKQTKCGLQWLACL